MTSGTQTREGWFIEVGQSFHDVLVCSRVFSPPRWIMLEKIPGDVASRCWSYLVAKPSHTVADVDGLACPWTVLRSAVIRRGARASCQALSCPVMQQRTVVPYWGMWCPELGYLWRCWPSGYLCLRVLHRACCFYQDRFTISWNHYDVYACIPGRATLSDSDGMGPSTRVYAVRCAWVPATTSYPVR
jgi:hypothetical protein